MTSQRLCFSRARWPMAPNFCSRATSKSLLFHRNHMLGTLDFTRSENWAPFNFSQSTALQTVCTNIMQGQKDTQSQDCYKNHKVEPLHNSHQKSMYLFTGTKEMVVEGRRGMWKDTCQWRFNCISQFTPTCDRYIQERENFLLTCITISGSSNQVCGRLRL